MTSRSVVLHGHFYQPPREDPWLDEVEADPTAVPFHDWNVRVERDCYRAVVAARRYAPDGRIQGTVNTLAALSFDAGPTLLHWLERAAPATYAGFVAADRVSCERLGGHGNAIAMPYHHTILPLASHRDKVTEVRWGIADFVRRFGRMPEGMWLPETAVDEETLDVLASQGIAFTVLAPHQVAGAPPRGLPGRWRATGGRSIAIFTYDGAISHDVAFGPLLRNAEQWRDRLLGAVEGDAPAVAAIALDGETFGHHHRFGEVALAWLQGELARRSDVRVENFASVLARHPPAGDVTLVAPSSWSCPHGVERWRADCGCRMAPEHGTQQRWRAPLRGALEWLAGELHALFEREGAALFTDPWSTRDACGTVVSGGGADLALYVTERLRDAAHPATRVRARELLELERFALGMFTSCGWFFDDVAGVEGQQILRYAARAIELAGADAARLEAELLHRLAQAPSNDPGIGEGRRLYLQHVKPRAATAARVAAGFAAARRFAPEAETPAAGCYIGQETGDRTIVTHCRTGREAAFRVSMERAGGSRLVAEVRPEDGSPAVQLGLADLPERYRLPIVGAWRGELVQRCLTAHEITRVASGGGSLIDVVGEALGRAVAALRHDRSAPALARAADLVDLLDLAGGHIPFDVQTAFDRVRTAVPHEERHLLAPVAWRLGFSESG